MISSKVDIEADFKVDVFWNTKENRLNKIRTRLASLYKPKIIQNNSGTWYDNNPSGHERFEVHTFNIQDELSINTRSILLYTE